MGTYEFRFRGRLSPAARDQLAQLELAVSNETAETVVLGDVEDHAALHGLLRSFETLGLDVVEVRKSPSLRPPEDEDG